MHKLAGILVVLAATAAQAAPVAIDRDTTLQQLQTIGQEIAIVQQQIDASPALRSQLAWSLQQLAAAQLQLGALTREVGAAQFTGGAGGAHPPTGPAVLTPIGDATLRSLLQQINAVGFSDDKVNVLRQATLGNYFLVDQAMRILPLYAHATDRLAALKLLAPQLLDRGNNFKLLPLFSFSGDREAAQRILEGAPPLQVR